MILSEERQSHLARLIVDGIWNDDLVDYSDDDHALRATKKALALFAHESEQIDRKTKEKIASLKRGVQEGTPEWDVLYHKYFDEELIRHGQK